MLNLTFKPHKCGHEIKFEYGKRRELQKPRFFPDQCIHHVMILLIYDKIIKRIDPHAMANIKNRGIKSCKKILEYWIQKRHKRETTYCGKGDIRHCFESISPEVAYSVFTRMIKDKKYLEIMRRIIFSWKNLPLGNYLSAWIVNLLLKDLDSKIRSCKCVTHYLRYMDDFVFFSSNRRKAKLLKEIIIKELAKIGLTLKSNYQLFKIDDRGLDIVGYRFFRYYTILRKRNFKRILKHSNIIKRRKLYNYHNCISIISKIGFAKLCNSRYLYHHIGKLINFARVKQVIRNFFNDKKRSV